MEQVSKKRIGILMGGFNAERHVSLESGRNVYEKLAASICYTPIPIFLSGTWDQHELFVLPIHLLLQDNADDIHQALRHPRDLYSLVSIQAEAAAITRTYARDSLKQPQRITYGTLRQWVDFVFLALHGRPGEDGTLQAVLEQEGIPYNGSGIASTRLTINKFDTNQFLRSHGIPVADQALVTRTEWDQGPSAVIARLEKQFSYPFIAKPVDEGCSAAVMRITNSAMLVTYAAATFRQQALLPAAYVQSLALKPHAEFPPKEQFLVEALVTQGDAVRFLEITGGLLTHREASGSRRYEIFAPSEVLAKEEVLSLEEKFLVGEGQNNTPACFHTDPTDNGIITDRVRHDLERVARLLDVAGYARIDAFVKVYNPDQVETWIIEVNALPGMTPATCIFHQCALQGYTPLAFIHAIIQYGLKQ